MPLVDAGAGGSGEQVDLDNLRAVLEQDTGIRIVLAGGLEAGNVKQRVDMLGDSARSVVAVDVSSGVEDTNGKQDLDKIREFVKAAKAVRA